MPEGDTIWRAAHTLHRALAGQTVSAARAEARDLRAEELVGLRVTAVESRGKHLLIHFDDGHALRSHMRMRGSWHIYRPHETWQKPEHRAKFVLETPAFVAVCFDAPVVELLSERKLARHPELTALGPDVLKADDSLVAARERLRQVNSLTIGEALLLQRAVAGIGNIYKSETLFLCRVCPFSAVRELSDATLDRVLQAARRLMTQNLGTTPRRTSNGGPRFSVYRRSGRPCPRCGASIAMRRQGMDARSTYYCPSCQSHAE